MTAVETVQAFWEALTPGFRWEEDFNILFDIARQSDGGMICHDSFIVKDRREQAEAFVTALQRSLRATDRAE